MGRTGRGRRSRALPALPRAACRLAPARAAGGRAARPRLSAPREKRAGEGAGAGQAADRRAEGAGCRRTWQPPLRECC